MKTNIMKKKLLGGDAVFGISIMIPSPQIVEMVAQLGFEWVLIDCEHGTISLETVEALTLAAEANGITPIARPPKNSAELIGQLLDRGVMGVQVPHVRTADDARRAVAAVKFFPQGERSLAAGTRPSAYGLSGSVKTFTEQSNRETLICVQLEDPDAIRNADAILTVEGVDVFFIGPSDLSQSMGFTGDPGAVPVKAAVDQTLEKIVAAGKIPGMPVKTASVAELQQRGVRYVYTHLPHLMSHAAREFFAAAGQH